MTTYTSNRVAFRKWIDSVHTDPNWRSPTAEREMLSRVPVIPGYATAPVLPPTEVAEVQPDRMTGGEWFVTLGGAVVIVLFLLTVFLPFIY